MKNFGIVGEMRIKEYMDQLRSKSLKELQVMNTINDCKREAINRLIEEKER